MSFSSLSLQSSAVLLDQQLELTLNEVGRACAVQADFIVALVQQGVLAPTVAGPAPELWRFPADQVRHVSVAARLQRDLGVNLAGAALVLQLLDELQVLRAQLQQIEQAHDDVEAGV